MQRTIFSLIGVLLVSLIALGSVGTFFTIEETR